MIGEIMIELGFIWAEHVVDARRHQAGNPPTLRLPPSLRLRRTGRRTGPNKPFDLAQGKRLGECLMELGYVNEENIRTALTVQQRGTL